MSKATMTVEGYLAADGQLRYTQAGKAVLGLSVPHTPRKKNQQTQQWEDAGDTLWVRISLWGDEAEAFEPHAVKGTQVVATGEPELQTWEKDGRSGVNLALKFAKVSIVPKADRSSARPPQQPQQDEWHQDEDTPF